MTILIHQASAALVEPCAGGATGCGLKELIQTGVNVIQFMINTAAILAVIFFLWGGFLLLTSGGSAERISQGKKAVTAAVVGLVIILASVIIINTVVTTLTKCHFEEKKGVLSIGLLKCPEQ
jgi:hypothetical protein